MPILDFHLYCHVILHSSYFVLLLSNFPQDNLITSQKKQSPQSVCLLFQISGCSVIDQVEPNTNHQIQISTLIPRGYSVPQSTVSHNELFHTELN